MITDNELLGTVLGKYYLTKRLGRGGMSVIYSGKTLTQPPRSVAVKVLRPPRRDDTAEDFATFLERFRREAKIIARLQHPSIVPIYDYGEERRLAYIVMEHEESSLDQVLNTQGHLSLQETNTYLHQICAALDYAHKEGIIHRDLKPSNILLNTHGEVVLADFGISRIRMSDDPYDQVTLTRSGIVLGTPAYMAPEMFRTRNFDYSVDIYALGIILYEMLSGQLPFKGNHVDLMDQHMSTPLPALHERYHTIPKSVDQVLRRAAAKAPENRYRSARELARDFQRAIQLVVRTASSSGTRQYYYGSRPSRPENAVHYNRPHHLNPDGFIPPPVRQYPLRQPPPRIEPISNKGTSRPPRSTPSRPGTSRPPYAVGSRREPISQPGRQRQPVSRKPPSKSRHDSWGWFWFVLIFGVLITLAIVYVNSLPPSQQQETGTGITPTVQVNATPRVTLPSGPSEKEARNAYDLYNQEINQKDYEQAYNMLGPQKKQELTLQQFIAGYTNTIQQTINFKAVTRTGQKNQFRVEVTIQATEKGDIQHTYNWQGTLTLLDNGSWQIDDYTQTLVKP